MKPRWGGEDVPRGRAVVSSNAEEKPEGSAPISRHPPLEKPENIRFERPGYQAEINLPRFTRRLVLVEVAV